MKLLETFLFCALALLFFSQCSSNKMINSDTGECLEKSIMPNKYVTEITRYNVYTGDATTENVEVETMELITTPESGKWIKKKKPGGCLSANPDDCYLMCFEKTPAVTENLTILKDPSQSENYEVREIKKRKLVKKAGYKDWEKVLCKSEVTPKLVSQLQESLVDKGYKLPKNTKSYDSFLKDALYSFQKKNNLPSNSLNLKTLEALGIAY